MRNDAEWIADIFARPRTKIETRTLHCLHNRNLATVGDVRALDLYELFGLPNFGKKCFDVLLEKGIFSRKTPDRTDSARFLPWAEMTGFSDA